MFAGFPFVVNLISSPQLRAAYLGILMMTVLHGYLKYTQPLFVQSLMGIKNLYDAKPVAIHIFGRPAEGDLKRPFKVVGMFGGESSARVVRLIGSLTSSSFTIYN
jgi:hypothetical protein